MKLFYSPDYVLSETEFDTTRKSEWLAQSLTARPIASVEIVAPEPVTEADLLLVHQQSYIRAVQTGEPRYLAESQGFEWDAKLWTMTTASTGGAVAAALAAMEDGIAGSLSSGLHHARRERGEGFCTFNGLALAATKALAAGASSVLILDLDAHCGGGTHSIVSNNPAIWNLDVSVSDFDNYHPTERTTRDLVTNASDYLPTIRRRLQDLDDHAPRFGLCLYNAGMDPCAIYYEPEERQVQGISPARLAEREEMVFAWSRRHSIPLAFVLAGGYIGPGLDAQGLVNLHRLTLESANRAAQSSSASRTWGEA